MPLSDLLNIYNEVIIKKDIIDNDNMGGNTITTKYYTLPKAAIWINNKSNKFISDKDALSSTHVLCFEYGEYSFNDNTKLTSSQSMLETVIYNKNKYKTSGFADNVMQLNEIIVQGLERVS